ncbi:hypothetical protein OPV22_014438 [Ensete ventricosum]|uniref:Uncharacterized protein n=1 Tax=Ensete ventricosum TaxID=4639 RepID=A0AAV8RBG2_ENSVE|nr:hypothetical protein OPV22_014438 [Ensete ventricosum]
MQEALSRQISHTSTPEDKSSAEISSKTIQGLSFSGWMAQCMKLRAASASVDGNFRKDSFNTIMAVFPSRGMVVASLPPKTTNMSALLLHIIKQLLSMSKKKKSTDETEALDILWGTCPRPNSLPPLRPNGAPVASISALLWSG